MMAEETFRGAVLVAYATANSTVQRINDILQPDAQLCRLLETWELPNPLFPVEVAGLPIADFERFLDAMKKSGPLFTSSPAAGMDVTYGPVGGTAWHWAVFNAMDEILRHIMDRCGTDPAIHWYHSPVGAEERIRQRGIFRSLESTLHEEIRNRFGACAGEKMRVCRFLIKERDYALAKAFDLDSKTAVATPEQPTKLASTVAIDLPDNLTPQQQKIFECLKASLGKPVGWDNLPESAFQDRNRINDSTVHGALKRLRNQLNATPAIRFSLHISEAKRTVVLTEI